MGETMKGCLSHCHHVADQKVFGLGRLVVIFLEMVSSSRHIQEELIRETKIEDYN